jgi:hypothetical protein
VNHVDTYTRYTAFGLIGIDSRGGQPFNRVIINRDEDRLRSSGDFDDVRVTVENGPNGGPIVTFNVREKRP